METFPPIEQLITPTPERPLLGTTVLIVEDSRYASEALRLLCQKSGARIRRADCLASARRHLKVFRPSVVLIDLGLPDGSGLDLIREIAGLREGGTVLLGISGDDSLGPSAFSAGAAGFICKPISSLAAFQRTILSYLPAHAPEVSLWCTSNERVTPDHLAYIDDMRYAADTLTFSEDKRTLFYIANFLQGVAGAAADTALQRAANDLFKCCENSQPVAPALSRLAALLQERLAEVEIA